MASYTVWLCVDCMLHHANGECGSCHLDEGHDREPLSLISNDEITMGLLNSEHSEGCNRRTGSYINDCDCETLAFSWSSCPGCGSTLGGKRHAFAVWFND